MAGYREHGFDPTAFERPGPPLRPFNWVQWTGAALVMIGVAIYLAYFAGQFGWTSARLASPMFGLGPMLLGVTLVNSRRQPGHDLAPELAAARMRWLIIVSIICALILGAAAIIDLKGA